MADLPRLNNVIRALEAGQHALTCFAPAHVDSAIAMSASKYDGCVFEMEHNPWDSGRLRDCLQYMLNRAQIAKAGLVPPVAPMVRIPVNGVEMAQWQAKQALDSGCYGIVFPHISTVEEAANAVGAGVVVVASAGNEPVDIPDVRGQTPDEAPGGGDEHVTISPPGSARERTGGCGAARPRRRPPWRPPVRRPGETGSLAGRAWSI